MARLSTSQILIRAVSIARGDSDDNCKPASIGAAMSIGENFGTVAKPGPLDKTRCSVSVRFFLDKLMTHDGRKLSSSFVSLSPSQTLSLLCARKVTLPF